MEKQITAAHVQLLLVACAFFVGCFANSASAAAFRSGDLSFSDELGGFRLVSASGTGSIDDPYVVSEEILDVAPVTLVIRRLGPVGADGGNGYSAIHLQKNVTNKSGRVWAGFEMELREELHKPSTYSDGLSFNQISELAEDISSDVFATNRREYEPDDRIRFESGHVDPAGKASFQLTITDPTPTPVFYLIQDPQLLSAALPGRTYAFLVKARPASTGRAYSPGASTKLTPFNSAMWSESVGR